MQKAQTISLVILATIAVGFSLFYLKTVLLPFVISVFIVIGCRPIVEFVGGRLKLPRIIAFVISSLVGLLLLFAFGFLIWISINDLSRDSDAYKDRLNHIASWVVERFPNTFEKIEASQATRIPEQDPPPVPTTRPDLSENDPARALHEFSVFMSAYVQRQSLGLASSLSGLLSNGVLIMIFVLFLMLGNGAADSNTGSRVGEQGFVGEVEEQIRRYLFMKTAISLATGFLFGLTLWWFGVPLAIVFGFLAFLLNFIPNIGPLISIVLPLPFLILNSHISPAAGVTCFCLTSVIQFVSGNVIETRLMGKSFDVSPVALLLGLMFFGLVWGIIGMFLATPLISVLKIVLQRTEGGQPLAELLAGRWSSGERPAV